LVLLVIFVLFTVLSATNAEIEDELFDTLVSKTVDRDFKLIISTSLIPTLDFKLVISVSSTDKRLSLLAL